MWKVCSCIIVASNCKDSQKITKKYAFKNCELIEVGVFSPLLKFPPNIRFTHTRDRGSIGLMFLIVTESVGHHNNTYVHGCAHGTRYHMRTILL